MIPKFTFAVLDTEATGLTPGSDKILEIAIVRYERGEKVLEYESLFDVDREIPPHVQTLTRIKPRDICGRDKFDPAKITPIIQDAVLIGHNITFDIGMLKGEGVVIEDCAWIDTAMLASIVFPECDSWSLPYLASVLNLPHKPIHRAMGDARASISLFDKICERIACIPPDVFGKIVEFSKKGPRGYSLLFDSIRFSGGACSWMDWKKKRALSKPAYQINCPILDSRGKKTWLAVKKLHVSYKCMDEEMAKQASVIHAPQFIIDQDSKKIFLNQNKFTEHELTLAIKLLLYNPVIQHDFPIHSDERDVWKGKLACTPNSAFYREQIKNAGTLVIIDHRQLLELACVGDGPSRGDHVVIHDASVFEDSATKALSWSCSINPLRAAAEDDRILTSFLDAYQIWVEKVRNFRDVRYIVDADLIAKDARGLRERLSGILSGDLKPRVRDILNDLDNMLDPKKLAGRIAYVSQFRDGGQIVQSVPLDIAKALKNILYDKFHTVLIVPPAIGVPGIVTADAKVKIKEEKALFTPVLIADERLTMDRLINIFDGKAIVLVPSKRAIEQLFIKYAEKLEFRGITVIAQGLSGGLGRMQAEFCAAKTPIAWFVTPWAYEMVELPAETADHLWICALPFDHPSHAVLSRRSKELYSDAFNEYYMPRLLGRIFRLLRAYEAHKKENASVVILDERIRTKKYGVIVRDYLKEITAASPQLPESG